MTSAPSAPPDELALIARLRAGEEAAYVTLVESQTGRMLAVARRMLRSEEDARDAVQEAFVSAFKSIERFEGGSKLSTWLHRIVVNAALMKLRSQKRKPETSIDDLMPNFLEDGHHASEPTAWRASPEDHVRGAEDRKLVRDKIDELPTDYRTVLWLRDIEELDTKETADQLGITPNAVKIRLHRARIALRGLLDPHLQDEEAR